MTIGLIAGLGEFQRADQQRQIVAVDRPEITQAHFLEDQAAAVTAAAIGIRSWLVVCSQADFGHGALESLPRPCAPSFKASSPLGKRRSEALEILCQLVVATDG